MYVNQLIHMSQVGFLELIHWVKLLNPIIALLRETTMYMNMYDLLDSSQTGHMLQGHTAAMLNLGVLYYY